MSIEPKLATISNGSDTIHIARLTKAQARARKERLRHSQWDGRNIITISTRVPRATAERYRAHCQGRGITMYEELKEHIANSTKNG